MSEWEEWVSSEVEGGEFPCLRELCIRRCPKLKGNLPKQLPSIVKVEIFESQELVTTPMTEASSHKRLLEYHDKVLLISEVKVASFMEQMTVFKLEDAAESSLLMVQGATASSFESMRVSKVSELIKLPSRLHSLKIEGCDDLEFIPEGVIGSINSLQHFYIINCPSLKSFTEDYPPTDLKTLYIRNCKKLEFIKPAEKRDRCLSIWDCANLESLSKPEGIQEHLTSLEALEIRDCPSLVYFPKGGLPTPNLTFIWLSNRKNLKNLPDQLQTLKNLQSMFLNKCPELESHPDGGWPSNLSLFCVTFCDKLMPGKEWGLHGLDCLSHLEIEGKCENMKSFPKEKLLPRNLNSHRISGFMDLKYLDSMGLQHLSALKRLDISCCDQLQSLPEDGLPSSLSFLSIKECSLLKSKLRNKKGKYWSKIAHISCIEIDEEFIS
nr:putative disease resistance protein [Quercus suber]